ncbi:phosphate signaling complex protein PhoU [Lacicoccus alkaliphilus]|uniref:Phosphate-specific transport system accessory protein PhoU n=1 Tax=Lacicoccus alkaliphilus DSM 16010 TaxID=1123231 RepID=A0A1M7BIU6_9BACL|nr:phosphate signaling complex protein PhoU [Salinicoccus alkaliphilus]SHL54843.1 phosphate transport system protein [Salinicoccus alkaliphilus DSM 16010]
MSPEDLDKVGFREKYTGELQALVDEVIELGRLCYERLQGVTGVLSMEDITPARELVLGDKEVNRKEYNINSNAVTLITTQAPVATDTRIIISSIKIAYDLERISDNIGNLGEVRKRVKITNEKLLLRLSTMEQLASLMLKDVLTAYLEQDASLCEEVYERDEDIDSLFVHVTTSDIFEETDLFVTGQSQLCAKYLERIGDHVKNIAEHVYFVLTGDKIEKLD